MNLTSQNGSKRKVRSISRFGSKTLIRKTAAAFIAIAGLTILSLPVRTAAQERTFFSVASIIKDVETRYKLCAADLRSIIPIIRQENENVVLIYTRFGGDEPNYSPELWREVVDRRVDFEKRIGAGFTQTERSALRLARTRLERRILNTLVDDYVLFLADNLELGDLETEAVGHLFRAEKAKKHRLIVANLSRQELLESGLRKISLDTERDIRTVLSGEQFKVYRSLTEFDENSTLALVFSFAQPRDTNSGD